MTPATDPRTVLLFSGHMIDAADRDTRRFPPDREPVARDAIDAELDRLDAAPGDLAICGGACGGDLLFAESALRRGVDLDLYLPFDVPVFVERSVAFAGAEWVDRFDAVRARSRLHVMGDRRPGEEEDAYARNNLRMLEAAGRYGVERIAFVCLWDGGGGDGPGGTRHLVDEVRRRHGAVHWIDTTRLWA